MEAQEVCLQVRTATTCITDNGRDGYTIRVPAGEVYVSYETWSELFAAMCAAEEFNEVM